MKPNMTWSPGASQSTLGPDLLDDAGSLVAADDRQGERQVAGHQMLVGVAQAGADQPHQDLAVLRGIQVDLLDAPVLADLPQDRGSGLHGCLPPIVAVDTRCTACRTAGVGSTTSRAESVARPSSAGPPRVTPRQRAGTARVAGHAGHLRPARTTSRSSPSTTARPTSTPTTRCAASARRWTGPSRPEARAVLLVGRPGRFSAGFRPGDHDGQRRAHAGPGRGRGPVRRPPAARTAAGRGGLHRSRPGRRGPGAAGRGPSHRGGGRLQDRAQRGRHRHGAAGVGGGAGPLPDAALASSTASSSGRRAARRRRAPAGFLDRVVAPDELLAVATSTAAGFAALRTGAVAGTKTRARAGWPGACSRASTRTWPDCRAEVATGQPLRQSDRPVGRDRKGLRARPRGQKTSQGQKVSRVSPAARAPRARGPRPGRRAGVAGDDQGGWAACHCKPVMMASRARRAPVASLLACRYTPNGRRRVASRHG